MNGIFSGLPLAWVVKCKKCGCTITCRAIDPQTEHAEPLKAEPAPPHPVMVSCSCCWAAYRYNPAEIFKGQPAPSSACFESRKADVGGRGEAAHKKEEGKKANGAILIAASLIAAVRLHKEEIKPSPSLTAKITDSIRLAEMVEARLRR